MSTFGGITVSYRPRAKKKRIPNSFQFVSKCGIHNKGGVDISFTAEGRPKTETQVRKKDEKIGNFQLLRMNLHIAF